MARTTMLLLILAALATACTTTVTQADLDAEGRKWDEQERSLEASERGAEEVGGRNMEAMGESVEHVEQVELETEY